MESGDVVLKDSLKKKEICKNATYLSKTSQNDG